MPSISEKNSNKGNRCWPGYEPVHGKAEHSQGSCRPKPKKSLTATERKSRAARERQLDRWQKEHPGSPRKAAQHLHPSKAAAKRKPSAKKNRSRKKMA
jgi:hypothetical protein